ncbi:MAG: 4Fe-4S binding protein [Anaerolineaceae bacterium]|nr:4Fe-4S binding protein [Anaerolineaceae bacterium]
MGIPLLSNASLHSLCPFGGVVSLYQFFTVGTFVQKIHQSAFVLMALSFLLAILAGPVFCGWVCPLGSIQEWVGKIGKKLSKKYNHIIPARVDKILRYTRYLVLGWVVYMTAVSGKLIFSAIDPYFALFNFWSSEVAIGGLIVLGTTLVLSLVIERPWCKYACPYGALLGISNLFRIFKIHRQESSCIQCGLCSKACPMNIEVDKQTTIKDHQCISCLECSSEASCPIDETVTMKTGGK